MKLLLMSIIAIALGVAAYHAEKKDEGDLAMIEV